MKNSSLVTTCMRFPEATGPSAADVDAEARTCRTNKAWKYSGDYRPEIGPTEDEEVDRTASLSRSVLQVLDFTAPGLVFTNGAGNFVRVREFFNDGWTPGRTAAMTAGLTQRLRVRDLGTPAPTG